MCRHVTILVRMLVISTLLVFIDEDAFRDKRAYRPSSLVSSSFSSCISFVGPWAAPIAHEIALRAIKISGPTAIKNLPSGVDDD